MATFGGRTTILGVFPRSVMGIFVRACACSRPALPHRVFVCGCGRRCGTYVAAVAVVARVGSGSLSSRISSGETWFAVLFFACAGFVGYATFVHVAVVIAITKPPRSRPLEGQVVVVVALQSKKGRSNGGWVSNASGGKVSKAFQIKTARRPRISDRYAAQHLGVLRAQK